MDYVYLYKKLNKRTPLKEDCGLLCHHKCCDNYECENMGMYLFPNEEKMFLNKDGFKVENSDLKIGNKNVKILFCNGICKREERPLSCRIFPLFPYITVKGELMVVKDIRGRGLCPLFESNNFKLSSSFIRGVKHVGKYLMNDREGFDFIFSLSRILDEERKELLEELNKLL